MRIWGKEITNHRITNQAVWESSSLRLDSFDAFTHCIHELCQLLELERPVILNKHFKEFTSFNRVVFKSPDFIGEVGFDAFEVEIIVEKRKERI